MEGHGVKFTLALQTESALNLPSVPKYEHQGPEIRSRCFLFSRPLVKRRTKDHHKDFCDFT
jgi:hypothetical protein